MPSTEFLIQAPRKSLLRSYLENGETIQSDIFDKFIAQEMSDFNYHKCGQSEVRHHLTETQRLDAQVVVLLD